MSVMTGCDSTTAPPLPVVATVVSHVGTARLLPPSPGWLHNVACDVTYELLPTRKPLQWVDAAFHYHFGASRINTDELIYISGEHIQDSWKPLVLNGRTIIGGQWEFGAGVPFSVTAEMSYTVEGETTVKLVRSRFSCGPEPGPDDATPTVTATVSPRDGVGAGSQLRVSYSATSGVGLWETAIHVTGAYAQVTRVPEDFHKSSTGEVVLTVPAVLVPGQPIHIGVSTTDVGMRSTFVTFTLFVAP